MIRIATWNMDHQRNASPMVLKRQLDFMAAVDCDVWLLTEVPYTFRTVMGPGSTTFSAEMDRTHKAFAAVWSKDGLEQELDPIHEGAAFASVNGLRVCSCMLPSGAMARDEWPDKSADRGSITIQRLGGGLADGPGDLVWGGTWNQALRGQDGALGELIATLDLQVPTATLDGCLDHIAVPSRWSVGACSRLVARADDERLSAHDAYVVEVQRP